MTVTHQQEELKRRIWQIANDVRGTVDGWDINYIDANMAEIERSEV